MSSAVYSMLLLWRVRVRFSHPPSVCRLKDVQSLDELNDVYNHFLLYYGRDVPKMQNAAKVSKRKKKMKKIIEVNEDGESLGLVPIPRCCRRHGNTL